jgi:hypothetical protein
MKLFIRGFSQDVDLLNPEQADNFLVLMDEETGNIHRLPVPMETIAAVAAIAQGEELPEQADEPKEEPYAMTPEEEQEHADHLQEAVKVQPRKVKRMFSSEEEVPSV